MVSSTSLFFGCVSIFLYVTPSVSNTFCDNVFKTIIERSFEVVLGYSYNRMIFCGGTLITNFYVLTAAECVINRQPKDIAAFTAIKNLSARYDGQYLRAVNEVIVHALYNQVKPWNHNIALLRLGRLFFTDVCVFNPWVKKAIVPQKVHLDEILRQEQLQVRLSGFGITPHKGSTSGELLISNTTLVDPKYCRELYERFQYNISDKHICVYDPSKSVNSTYNYRISDVGGPLIVNQNVILGIALNLVIGSDTYYPMVFTNVAYYRDWIERVISRYDEDDLEIALMKTWNPEQVYPS